VSRRVTVIDVNHGKTLAVAALADTVLSRMVGLLGRSGLARGDGLVIRRCSMVHTCFMRFPIDVLFADRAGSIVAVVDTLRPFRLAWGGWRATQVVELPAGALRQSGVALGGRISIEPAQ
jgi:uncharacterized membrane protein (UPF0127 family)